MTPSNPIRIAPSLLAADFLHLSDEIAAVERGGADRLHLDVMDGVFVPNITFGMPVIRAARKAATLPLEAHLMITAPDRYIEAVAEAGADTILIQIEAATHLDRALNQIKQAGKRAGLVLNPATPLDSLSEIVELLDVLLLMTVNPGFGGQRLIGYTLEKVRRARELLNRRNPECDLEVDGGIDVNTIASAAAAGANVFVAGTAVFAAQGGAASGIAALLEAARSAR